MAQKFDSVVMYSSWLDVARSKLSEEDACRLMVQIMEYGLYGKIPENDNVIMDVIFEMAKPNIDSNIRKKIGGKKGGRKKKTDAKTIGLNNANANGNVNANGNANVKANENDAPSSAVAPAVAVAGDEASEASSMPDWMTEGPNGIV